MRIIQIIPNLGLGGAEIMCETLTRELLKTGNSVLIISLYSDRTAITERLEKDGINLIFLNKKKHFDVKAILKLKKIIKYFNPDIIHTHLYALKYAIFATFFTKRKIIHTVHNLANKECGKIDRWFNGHFFKTKRVIPVGLSQKIKDTIVKEYKLDESSVSFVLNGVDLSNCLRKENYLTNNGFKLINISRFSPQKNHVRLIDAFNISLKRNPNLFLLLIGDGEEKKSLEIYVEKLKLSNNIIFLGQQSNVFNFLHDSDAFILSSDFEGVPMSLIEAMGTGLPIISTDVGGIMDMIDNEKEGILTKCNERDLSNAILRLANDKLLREKIGRQAYIRSNSFSSQNMASNYLNVYKGLLNEN